MSELELERIRNISTISAGKEDPSKVTQHMHCSMQRCIQNKILDAAQLALPNLVPPHIDTSQQQENDDIVCMTQKIENDAPALDTSPQQENGNDANSAEEDGSNIASRGYV
jgi:hypothetical protein